MTHVRTRTSIARPVGGMKERVSGAHRAGANRVILPWANRKDVEHDVAKEVCARIQSVFVKTVREVLDAAFGPGSLPWHAPDTHPLVESMGRVVNEMEYVF